MNTKEACIRLFFLIIPGSLLLSSCSNLFYYPNKGHIYYAPEITGYTPEDVYFTDAAQRKLHGWWLPAKKTPTKATIIFFHGNAENLTSHYLHLAWITAEEYNLFIFDYPGYGLSEGKPTPESCVDSGHAAVDWVINNKSPKDEPIIIYGQSMGGIVALRTAIDKKSEINLKLVVADSTFDSFQHIAQNKLAKSWLTWLIQPLSYILLSDHWAPGDLKSISPSPVLVIHGLKDVIVEPELGERIFEKLAEPKTLWKISDGTHTDVFWQHNHQYRGKFLTFLKNLDQP
jgi:pimeloyl-ACP methyl ester carboxylesterase